MELSYTVINELYKKYGDSFYVLDSERFQNNYKTFLNAFQKIYSKTFIGYSYKTNYTPFLCSLIDRMGGFAEVVSEMEYNLALKLGVAPHKIIVNGPYKTRSGIKKYLENGSLVNIDSLYELELLESISREIGDKTMRIGVRCNFKISDKYTSRFGFDANSKEFTIVLSNLKKIRNLSLECLHSHFPDRGLEYFRIRVEKMLEIVNDNFEYPPKVIDIGGGFFGKMPPFLASQFDVNIPAYDDYASVIAGAFNKKYGELNEKDKPALFLEPGSAIVADTLKFVTRIIDIKSVAQKHIAITSGSKFNLGAFSSSIYMPMDVYIDPYGENAYYDNIDISGFTCIESDYLFKNFKGSLGRGAFVSFNNVGSYSIVFKPPFILPNFPIIDINKKMEVIEIKRLERIDDIFVTYNFDA